MRIVSRIVLLAVLAIASFSGLKATHIAGAELVYYCVGTGRYNVKLTLYRDCNGEAPFDDFAVLHAFDAGTNALVNTFSIPRPNNTPLINPPNWSACVGTVPPFCVQIGVYESQILLPPNANGYYVGWARCCRNNNLTNLSQPECEGITLLANIPSFNQFGCNSMPQFNNTPSLFLCAGEPFYFDHSATDPDGDSLVYELSHPYSGLNIAGQGAGNPNGFPCGPALSPTVGGNNPMGPTPYRNIVWGSGYSTANPFGPGSSISINSQTGFLSAQPASPGIYLLAISVKEYRNGILLSENKRDFQFYVVNCLPQGPPPAIVHNLAGLNSSNDTVFITGARPFCYTFTVTDPQAPSTLVVTPVSIAFGGNGGFPPPYATLTVNGTTSPVTGTICWETSCPYVGQTVDFIITARDSSDCPNYNIVFDTIHVTILPPPNAPPAVTHSLLGVPSFTGDTIFADVGENFCFNFTIADTIGDGSLASAVRLIDSMGNLVPTQPTLTSNLVGDTIFGTVCFNTDCYYGAGYRFIIEGRDDYQCQPFNTSRDTVWLMVNPPLNPAPQTTVDFSLLPTNGDTIYANVHEGFCFDFVVGDTSGIGDSLFFHYFLQNLNGTTAGQASYSAVLVGDSIVGQICWTPSCVNVDLVYRLLIEGEQINRCGITNTDWDTVYIHVFEPIKPVPLISHDTGLPGNFLIEVADNDTFCFAFSLIDTVTPTYLSANVSVIRTNGQPFTGTPPSVVYQTQTSNQLEGTICWQVPCDLANESFFIKITGQDTFDCKSANIVFDSVRVEHTDLVPQPSDLCKVTVMPSNAGIEVSWSPSASSDVVGYILFRRREDQPALQVLDTIFQIGQLSYTDATALVTEYSYCYAVVPFDNCGNIPGQSDEHCTILLNGMAGDYVAELNWSAYIGWPGGVSQYELFRRNADPNSTYNIVATPTSTNLTAVDADISDGRVCYRVRALESGNGCGGESWSNEVCLEFPPLMFIPNAFTPNGDNLNDRFTAEGLFFESFELKIWDRWGKLLFLTRDAADGWDGTIGGQHAPEGVYVFQIAVKGYDGTELKQNGSLTLIR